MHVVRLTHVTHQGERVASERQGVVPTEAYTTCDEQVIACTWLGEGT
jgi:hypothetical protein